jgi:hypothetical protein
MARVERLPHFDTSTGAIARAMNKVSERGGCAIAFAASLWLRSPLTHDNKAGSKATPLFVSP